MELFIS